MYDFICFADMLA